MVKRRPYLDKSLPTFLVLSFSLAIFSFWSDVWEFYLFAFASFLILNLMYFKDVIRRVMKQRVLEEIKGALPRSHEHTLLKPPGNGDLDGFDDIHTGSNQGANLISMKVKILGVLTWIAWFGFGIRFWWFSDTRLIEYLVATVLWSLTFLFSILGIPVLGAILKNRKNL
jgi:hypothetical protein